MPGPDRLDKLIPRRVALVALAMCAVAIVLRVWLAAGAFLSPEEAWYCLIANSSGFWTLLENTRRADDSPLLILLLSLLKTVGSSELVMRFVPVVSGGLTAGLAYLWLQRRGMAAASLFAGCAFALAPAMIVLDAGVRAEPLLILSMVAGLLTLDLAIDKGSPRWMALFVLSLCLAILSGFGGGVFATAAGFYYLIRVSEPSVNAMTRRVWTIGQVAAAALFWWLYSAFFTSAGAATAMGAPWLSGLYPGKGEDPFFHIWTGTLGQFNFVMPSLPSAILALVLFAVALGMLVARNTRQSSATTVLLATPFLISYLLSFFGIAPYGACRENAFLGLFVIAGVALATEIAPRWRVAIPIALVLLLMPLWHLPILRDRYGVAADRNSTQQMREAAAFLKSSVPEGSLVLTDVETRLSAGYYLDPSGWIPAEGNLPTEDRVAGLRLWAARWSFAGPDDLDRDLAALRSVSGPVVWAMDGGYQNELGARLTSIPADQIEEVHDFGGAVTLLKLTQASPR